MKKFYPLFILIFIILSFFLYKNAFAETWYYTVINTNNDIIFTNDVFTGSTGEADCNAELEAYKQTPEYLETKSFMEVSEKCEKVIEPFVCPSGINESWRYKITERGIDTYSFIFECQQKCEENRAAFQTRPEQSTFACEKLTTEEVVTVGNLEDAKKYDQTYHLLAPIGDFKEFKTTNIEDYLNTMLKIAIGLCAALAVIMFIIYAVMYMGEESIFGKANAKSKMTDAIIGLIIALVSWALLNTIDPDLLGGRGLSIPGVEMTISAKDTSNGSSTSLCISQTNPPDPSTATGTKLNLDPTIVSEYLPELKKVNASTGTKLLITAQAAFEGFYPGSKSYRTRNPGNINNTDDGKTVTHNTLLEGIQEQADVIKNIVTKDKDTSYQIDGKYTCALGNETYKGYLYQYLRIYATGARINNNYLNAVIGYFKNNGKTIKYNTKISEIYNMN